MIHLFLILILLTSCAFAQESQPWGEPESHAVVNPAIRWPGQTYLPLSGDWQFATGNWFVRWRMGKDEPGYDYQINNPQTIQVPGTWEAQGVGQPGKNQTWDPDWDCYHADLKHKYMGAAIYQKTVDIPADWDGKQIWLKIGGVRTDAYIWVNKCKAAYVNNYCGTYKYNISQFIKPGQSNQIVAFVRNDTPSRKGLLSVVHAFGGFYRDIELEATSDAWIDDAWVRSDLKTKSAIVNVALASVKKENSSYKLCVNIKDGSGKSVAQQTVQTTIPKLNPSAGSQMLNSKLNLTANPTANPPVGNQTLVIPIPNARLWTPEQPNLYQAEVALMDDSGKTIHGWTERFGLRELKVVGKQFFLNGQPYFLRACGDHNYDPILLVQKPDRQSFVAMQRVFKAAGFNATRHHTHCPLPEYFQAADEVGLLLMPELPYYHDVPAEGVKFDPLSDIKELYLTNRRYVSFGMYCTGNEGFLGEGIDVELYRWAKQNDPDRIMQHQDGGKNTPDNSDFCTPNGYGLASSILPWTRGTFSQLDRPFIAHEYLNLSVKPNPYLESRYSGVVCPPRTMASYLQSLDSCGLTEDWGKRCIAAGERLQAYWQKQGLEQARLDPDCDGYGFWSISDAGAASQGYLTQFYQLRENAWRPEQFYQFNGPTVLLLETNPSHPVAVSKETIKATVSVSHFDAAPIEKPTCQIRLIADNQAPSVLFQKTVDCLNIPVGTVKPIVEFDLAIPEVDKACRAILSVELQSGGKTVAKNQWDYWIFPERAKPSIKGAFVTAGLRDWIQARYADVALFDAASAASDSLLIAQNDDYDALNAAISAGMRILILSHASEQPDVQLGWWSLGSQVGTAFADHPAFAAFPNRSYMDPLWFRLVRKGGLDMKRASELGRLAPLALGEGADSYYMYIGEAKIQSARILATFGLAIEDDTPEAIALLDSLIQYVRSEQFQPKTESQYKPPVSSAPAGTTLGFRQTLGAAAPVYDLAYYSSSAKGYYCRQTAVGNRLDWQTDPVPSSNEQTVTFVFAGGMGFASQKQTEGFRLLVNDSPVLNFDLAAADKKETLWKSPNSQAQLRFELIKLEHGTEDRLGKFFLTIPKSTLETGKPAKLSVESLGANSMRWFGLNSYRDLK